LLANEQYCFPDFLVQTKEGAYEVHEVKPSIASLSTDDLNRFAILSDLLHSIDITFKLIDHTDLPSETEFHSCFIGIKEDIDSTGIPLK
jgi:hypothetical protein